MTQNARYTGSGWVVDDTGTAASCIIFDPVDNFITFGWQAIGTSPFTTWQVMAVVSAAAASANYLQLIAQATGAAPQLTAQGADPNIGLNLVTKGTGTVQVNGQPIAQTGTGYLRLGPITQQWGTVVISNPGGDVWTAFGPITFPAAFSASAQIVVMTAWNGGTPTTNLERMCVVTNLTATTFAGWLRSGAVSGGSLVAYWLAMGPS